MKAILIVRLPVQRVIELSKLLVLHPSSMWVVLSYSSNGFMDNNVFTHIAIDDEYIARTQSQDPRELIKSKLGNCILDEIKP